MSWPGFTFRTREAYRINADEDFARWLRENYEHRPDSYDEEARRLDDLDAASIIIAVACPTCGKPAGARCFPASNDAHYERARAYALRPITRHLEGDA